MHNFENLRAWQAAKLLEGDVIKHFSSRACWRVPHLHDQIIGAAGSVCRNIAEGAGRDSPKEFRHFLDISIGSLNEVKNDLVTGRNSKIISTKLFLTLNNRAIVLRRMLHNLRTPQT